jgi:glycosyltransferase involved in cell wall biosynthesis
MGKAGNMKIALVHDWLTGLRGGERCLQAFLELYPDADIFTLLHVPGTTSAGIDARVKQTSFLQKFPRVEKYYRLLLPLYPWAAGSLNLNGYDLIISLSHAAAKNVKVPKRAVHICYCFSPMRYIWDQTFNYFGRLTPVLWPIVKYLRSWDLAGSKRVDHFVAISKFVAARIRCFYKCAADVIYPPVDTSWIVPRPDAKRGSAFLYAGALVPYKRVDLVIRAFNELEEDLWIVGRGPEEKKLKAMAGPNISFIGYVSDHDLAGFYRNCRALIFPGTEDFGMIPVECLAAGRPVIGAYAGGLVESLSGLKIWQNDCFEVEQSPTGVFFESGRKEELPALKEAIAFFIEREESIAQVACIRRSELFSPKHFRERWYSLLTQKGLSSYLPKDMETIYAQTEAAMV